MADSGLESVYRQVRLRSVYTVQSGSLEESIWLTGKVHGLLRVRKPLPSGHGASWDGGMVRDWEGMEIWKGFLILCKAPRPALLCSNWSPCQWPWCPALPCPVCYSGGSFWLPGWLATSENGEALARLGSDLNRQRGREKHVRGEITVLEKVLRAGI